MMYETPAAYLDALGRDPSLAIVPLTLAAQVRNVSRAAIDRMLRLGQLEEIKVGGTSFVRAQSLLAQQRASSNQALSVRAELERVASEGATITYQPLMDKLGLSHTKPADRTLIGKVLSNIGHHTLQEHGFVLSVLVHHKGKDRPGPGFLKEFRNLVQPGWRDDDDLIDREMRRVWDFYRRKQPENR